MLMELLIFAIIFGVIGAAFLGWGIYQIKTGKMVAKRRYPPIDEPREVGHLFVYLGILGSTAGLNFLFWWLDSLDVFASLHTVIDIPSMFAMLVIATVICGEILLVALGVYDLVKKRIYFIKTTIKTRSSIKKYYRPMGIAKIAAGLSAPVGIIASFELNYLYLADILFVIFIIAAVTICVLACKIDAATRPKKR